MQNAAEAATALVARVVAVLEVEEAVRVLHRREPCRVVDHVRGVVGKRIKHAVQPHSVVRVRCHLLRHADILDGAHIAAVLFLRAVQALLCRLDGPVVFLGEFAVAVLRDMQWVAD